MHRLLTTCWAVTWCWVAAASGLAAEKLWLNLARSSITSDQLHGHVGVLADDTLEGREAGSRGGRAAAHYITQRLEEFGLQPAGVNGTFTQPFGGNYHNLLAVLRGSDPDLQEEYIVVGAHYDHVGYGTSRNSYGPWGYIHNGADDNASGVATLLELIDALTATDHRPRRSLLFAFWDGEEKGLLGSKHWVRHPTKTLDAVRLAVNVDMVGRLTDGRLKIVGTRTGTGLRRLMSRRPIAEDVWLDFTWEYEKDSDHWSFFEAGLPSVCVHTGVHDDYHRPSDDVEKINFIGMQKVSRYLLERLYDLADAERLPSFRPQSRRETLATQRRLEKPLPPLAPRVNFTWEFAESRPNQVLVQHVSRGTPAAEAGLASGDRIVAVGGEPITGADQLSSAVLAGDTEISLEVERNGADGSMSLAVPLVGSPIRLGISWREDDAEPDVVFVTRVVPFSPAAAAGFRVHDRIYAVQDQSFSGQHDMLARIEELLAGDVSEIRFQVESRGAVHELVLPPQGSAPHGGDPTL